MKNGRIALRRHESCKLLSLFLICFERTWMYSAWKQFNKIICRFQNRNWYDYIPPPDYSQPLQKPHFYRCSRCNHTYFGHGSMQTSLICANCLAKNLPQHPVNVRRSNCHIANQIRRKPENCWVFILIWQYFSLNFVT